jgi:hypothetical protein
VHVPVGFTAGHEGRSADRFTAAIDQPLAGHETVDKQSVPLTLQYVDLLPSEALTRQLEIDHGNSPVVDQS